MLSLSGVVSAVGDQFGRSKEATDEDGHRDASPADGPQSSLFQCPDCESVYVAVDKERCTACETAVEQVPSTLSRTQ